MTELFKHDITESCNHHVCANIYTPKQTHSITRHENVLNFKMFDERNHLALNVARTKVNKLHDTEGCRVSTDYTTVF